MKMKIKTKIFQKIQSKIYKIMNRVKKKMKNLIMKKIIGRKLFNYHKIIYGLIKFLFQI